MPDTSHTISIRPEQPADHHAVDVLLRAAFGGPDEAALVVDLRAEPGAFTLVAELDGVVAGMIAFSPVSSRTPVEGLLAMGLGPMAVVPDRQGRGVGSALVRAGIEACRQCGVGLIVVLGHADFYPRFGFQPANRAGLRCRWSRESDDHFMYLELAPGQAALVGGAIEYGPAFDRFG